MEDDPNSYVVVFRSIGLEEYNTVDVRHILFKVDTSSLDSKADDYQAKLEELKAGNTEFRQAAAQTAAAMDAMALPELDYFREHFLPSYSLTLDELE